jgi:hypothetical protein
MAESMLPSTWIIGQTKPTWNLAWADSDSIAVDLTGATLTATIRAESATSSHATVNAPTVFQANPGIVAWVVAAAEVPSPGDYLIQFIATYSGGAVIKSFAGMVSFVAAN